jgi:hypothetical protein
MVSSYLPELLGVCDRIAVMSRGVLSRAYEVSELTPERVMQLAIGGEEIQKPREAAGDAGGDDSIEWP